MQQTHRLIASAVPLHWVGSTRGKFQEEHQMWPLVCNTESPAQWQRGEMRNWDGNGHLQSSWCGFR